MPLPSSTTSIVKKHKKTKECMLGFLGGAPRGSATALLFSLMAIVVVAIACNKNQQGITIFSTLIMSFEDLKFLTKEDGLANTEMIGRGGCGVVYKDGLPGSNNKMIAIKKIINEAGELADEESNQLASEMQQIRSEIQSVGKVRHQNLVPLLAHVSKPTCHYLVYEFMKNGSLEDILTQVSSGTRELDWPARHKIAVGVATGLENLHLDITPKIIHKDLKPTNILLDDNVEARIADFGLVKLMQETQTHITILDLAGTFGYIAPEYQTLMLTEKFDVFNFVVVLDSLVIGRLPLDKFFMTTEELGLVRWMRAVMVSDNPKTAINPKLMGSGYEERMLQVLKIACACTDDNPNERPNSKEIRIKLSEIYQFV